MKGSAKAIENINYSFVPNHRETMRALAMANLTTDEFSVVIALLNQTNGYLREEDEISSTFWQSLTFMRRTSVHRVLKRLIAKNVISRDGNRYRANHPNQWSPDIFRAATVSRRAIKTAEEGMRREREPRHYAWLKELLKASPGGDGKKRLHAETVRLQAETVRLHTETFLSPGGDVLATTKERENTKENTKDIAAKKSRKGDSRIPMILKFISLELGQPIAFYGKAGAAIKRALDMGYSAEEFCNCWREMKQWGQWQGQWLPLHKVTENLGDFRAGTLQERRVSGTTRGVRPKPDQERRRPITRIPGD